MAFTSLDERRLSHIESHLSCTRYENLLKKGKKKKYACLRLT